MQDKSELEKGYVKFLEEKRDYLKQLYPLDRNNWVYETEKDGITVHTMHDKKTGLKIVRAEGTMKAPRETVVEVAEEVTTMLEWDHSLEDIHVLHKSKEYYIVHLLIKKIPLTVQREVVLLARFFHEDDGTIYGASGSIEHPDVPESEYKVRASAHLVGWVLKPNPDNPEYTDFTMILHISPEGWIPNVVVNWFMHTQAYNVKPFGEYCELRHKKHKAERQERQEQNISAEG